MRTNFEWNALGKCASATWWASSKIIGTAALDIWEIEGKGSLEPRSLGYLENIGNSAPYKRNKQKTLSLVLQLLWKQASVDIKSNKTLRHNFWERFCRDTAI